MDYNVTVLSGTVTAKPDHRTYESGAELIKVLVTVRSEDPRKRVDVIPVRFWRDIMARQIWDNLTELKTGDRIHVTARIERKFWQGTDGRRSQLELLGVSITVQAKG